MIDKLKSENLSNPLTLRSGLGTLGAGVAIVGLFLQDVHAGTPFPIEHNTVVGNSAETAVIIALIALGGALIAYSTRILAGIQSLLVYDGILLLAGTLYLATGGRVDLEGTGPLAGQTFHGSPGIGVWAVGIGGVLIVLAGLLPGRGIKRSDVVEMPAAEEPETLETPIV